MNAENLVRGLIKSSIVRAIQESVAAVVVLIAFSRILQDCAVGSPKYYGCLLILVGTGFIVGVVWSFALSFRLLRTHPASDSGFWREAFHSQARLLRLVPIWYLAPIGAGAVLFVVPKEPYEILPSLIVATFFAVVFAFVIWLNRLAARTLEEHAARLVSN